MGQVINLQPIVNRLLAALRISRRGNRSRLVTPFHARRLPHFHTIGQPMFLTWRLAGSLPPNRTFSPELASGQAFLVLDRLLDQAQTGPVYLRRPEIARLVVEAILYQAQSMEHYDPLVCGHAQPCSLVGYTEGTGFPADAFTEAIHGAGGEPDAGPHREAVLAGREL